MKYGAVVQYYLDKPYAPDFWSLLQRAGCTYLEGAVRREVADEAANRGMKVALSYSGIVSNPNNATGSFSSEAAMVNSLVGRNISQYRNHAGVYGHILSIEPCNNYDFDPRNPDASTLKLIRVLKAGVTYIKQQDPTHPAWIGLNAAGAYGEGSDYLDRRRAWIRLFIDWCDVLDWHLYRWEIGGKVFTSDLDMLDQRTDEMLAMLKQESKGKPVIIGEIGVPTGTFPIYGNPSVTVTEQDQLTYFLHVAPKIVKYGFTPFIFKLMDDEPYQGFEPYFGIFRKHSAAKPLVDWLPSLFSGNTQPDPQPGPVIEAPAPEPIEPQDSKALFVLMLTAALAALKGEK